MCDGRYPSGQSRWSSQAFRTGRRSRNIEVGYGRIEGIVRASREAIVTESSDAIVVGFNNASHGSNPNQAAPNEGITSAVSAHVEAELASRQIVER